MSEYQYYEFLAVDRPLTPAQVAAVRDVSTRADITPTRFVNEYQWGNFKGDADRFLGEYFDCHVHVTNWGTRRFAFRVPKSLVDRPAIEAYFHDASLDVRPAGDWLIVDVNPEFDDGGEWDEADGHGWMGSLAGVRAEVLAGDLRPLYVGWLAGVQRSGPAGDGDEADADGDDESVPPVPPGMNRLSAPQRALADYVGLDAELLEVAAAGSPPPTPATDVAAALATASPADKDRWLLELLAGADPLAAVRIRRQLAGPARPAPASTRTVGQLRRAWGELDARRQRERADAAAVSRLRAAEAAAAAREQRLAALARRADAWREVDAFIAEKNRDGYAKAVALLVDLRDVADRPGGDPAGYQAKLDRVLHANARRYTFIEAARAAKLAPR